MNCPYILPSKNLPISIWVPAKQQKGTAWSCDLAIRKYRFCFYSHHLLIVSLGHYSFSMTLSFSIHKVTCLKRCIQGLLRKYSKMINGNGKPASYLLTAEFAVWLNKQKALKLRMRCFSFSRSVQCIILCLMMSCTWRKVYSESGKSIYFPAVLTV